MFRLLFLCSFLVYSMAQMQQQCTCGQVEPCKRGAENQVMGCADSCQRHVSGMGAPYSSIRACIMQKQPMINSVAQCQQRSLANTCAARPGGLVPKRYPETLKLAAFNEVNNMLRRSGLQAEAASFMAVGKKFAGCVMKCLNRGPGACFKRLGCGLALPPDNIIVQQTKSCAINAGFNTQGVQSLCQCVAGAGVKSLAPLCGRIQIT
ncbi:unnamed protein product, partial [Mesorhabditis belari]|uniref:Uncharacterized protein n=1 Tax=Mesorhabditis belari TaxID=2138241 RepID=A0AAF3F277_9BILA